MHVVIVNCFDTYEDRVDLIFEFFQKQGYDVTVIQSDFRHFSKIRRNDYKANFIFIKSQPYYKNFSLLRLYSHYKYARNAFKIVEDLNPDLLYAFVPPNSISKFAAKYKRKHKKSKLILDLIDLWPETMPLEKTNKILPFILWKNIRNNSFKYSNLIITECKLYQMVLAKDLNNVKTETIYLARKRINIISQTQLSKDEIHLAYLGSINNIIDISIIKEIIVSINKIKPVTLHIIGDGENTQKLINSAKSGGATVVYHGKIYDPQKKQNIFDICHFGLNIMKKNVCVGLTMKSIDYFQYGLPIINNIHADTADIVEKYRVGINVWDDDITEITNFIEDCNEERLNELRKNSTNVFEDLFSIKAFDNKLNHIIEKL